MIGERVRIASPVLSRELRGLGINEGQQILPHGRWRHIIYSASHSPADHYCLGQLTLIGDDPLGLTHWVNRSKPTYKSHKSLIAPGHAPFVLSPNEKYGWMIYHTARQVGAGWDGQVRLVAFRILEDGTLNFMPTKSVLDEVGKRLPLIRLLEKLVKPS